MRALLIPLLFAAGTARAAEDVPYRPDGFLRTGYSDKQVAPDMWRVKGSAHAFGGGLAVALYRAAELAMAARADEVRVTSQTVRQQTLTRQSDRSIVGFTEFATVTIRAVRVDADRAACDEKDPRECLTLPVAGLLARFGERLGRPIARPGEAPARPVAIVTYDHRQGGSEPWQVEAARRWPEPVAIPVRESPGLALLLGRLAASATARQAGPGPALSVAASPTPTPAQAVRMPPAGVGPVAPATARASAAEIERARLRAAAATDGDQRQGVTIR